MHLRKLGNYSRKNRLYQAFRELGRVVRTVFLLQSLSAPNSGSKLRSAPTKRYTPFASLGLTPPPVHHIHVPLDSAGNPPALPHR